VSVVVVGVDCATTEERTGLARGVVDSEGELRVERVTLGTAGESAAATVASWISGCERFVIGLDAPLGWPAPLGQALASHQAGQPLSPTAEQLFRRETDRYVQAELGKLPLEVGADRIARTARAALALLDEIRALTAGAVSLVWRPGAEWGAVEVYPAATLLSRSISPAGYKANTGKGRTRRAAVLDRLKHEVSTDITRELLIENEDLMDAMLCALAAADFARGDGLPPTDPARARTEGWIWFRGRGQRTLF